MKNVINGTLRAFWRDAMIDGLVTYDIFAMLKGTWPTWDHPEPDPWTPEEMRRILFLGSAAPLRRRDRPRLTRRD